MQDLLLHLVSRFSCFHGLLMVTYPFLELAKKLSDGGFHVFLCSTPVNLSYISKKIAEKYSLSIELVEFHLPVLSDLPSRYHTTSSEIEGKYIDYIADIINWKIVPVGPLIQDSATEGEDAELMEWLGEKKEYSTVFISFGSEYFLTKKEMTEIALGLELSSANFIWVLRYWQGETVDVVEALPDGFVERVKDRGRIVEGWAPQAKILGHSSVGGFVSHCGWNSVLEGLMSFVPIIALPMIHDQPLNARLAVEIGAAVEIMRDENGRLKREEIAKVIKDVLIGNKGHAMRRKMKDLSEKMKLKEKDLDEAVAVLSQLCEKSSDQGTTAL